MSSIIHFNYDGIAHEIELAPQQSPRTVAALLATLPAQLDLHCAKIAGQHIFWHAPFVEELEAATDIMTLPAGSFLYWPERQFLELIYGELQAETAAVSVLGRLTGDIQWLRDLGHDLVREHGQRILWAQLTSSAPKPAARVAEIPAVLDGLRAARVAAWEKSPADIDVLLARRGMMLPYGPLAMAEGELRKLHELLWRLWSDKDAGDASKSATAAFLLDAMVARVDGFCGMTGVGGVLRDAATLLRDDAGLAQPALKELVLYCGRVAAWLDLHICWNDMNEITLKALDRASR
jgi:hypothetical protein